MVKKKNGKRTGPPRTALHREQLQRQRVSSRPETYKDLLSKQVVDQHQELCSVSPVNI